MPGERASASRDGAFEERRAALAGAALQTLADLGYARTSLREIANDSEFSHGLLHYYFKDKLDLILCSVRQYKAHCVRRYDHVVDDAATAGELAEGFLATLAATARDDARLHRLWYDLRAQAMFTEPLRADVAEIDRQLSDMVWRVAVRYAELAGTPLRIPPAVLYAAVDGLFQQALAGHLAGDEAAVPAMCEQVRWVMAEAVGAVPVPA